MTFNQIIAPLKLTNVKLAAALGVSDSHIADLRSRRREISLSMAVRLEALTQRNDIVPAIAAARAKKDKAKARSKGQADRSAAA